MVVLHSLTTEPATTTRAEGDNALLNNTKGADNTAEGYQALLNNRTGNNNIALGVLAGSNLSDGDNNIDIGDAGVAGGSNHIRIGTVGIQKHTFIAGISGSTSPGGVGGNHRYQRSPWHGRFFGAF